MNTAAPNGKGPPDNFRVRVSVVSFECVRESMRLSLTRPDDVAELARQLIPDDGKEHFWALYVDAQNQLMAAHEVSVGSLAATVAGPREIFGPALRLVGVGSVILVHSHPSGDPTASADDIKTTQVLAKAGKLLGIRVLDHVIVGMGTGAFVSCAQPLETRSKAKHVLRTVRKLT